ncbi:MAG: hypothetical protein M3O31_08205 [Acidobacteriota bacterium]|nr:hypothetical protein [Acidobacteriota bacterium]
MIFQFLVCSDRCAPAETAAYPGESAHGAGWYLRGFASDIAELPETPVTTCLGRLWPPTPRPETVFGDASILDNEPFGM